MPVVLGGDHSIPIPVMRAYDGFGTMCVVQIDAHLDWRDEVNGVRLGLSSNMRRASELPFVTGMAQLGLRGVGSARAREYDDARAYGSVLISAAEIHRDGIEAALARIPAADRYYVTFDTDGLDPAVAPGIGSPAFGGLTYFQAFDLLQGVATKGEDRRLRPGRDRAGARRPQPDQSGRRPAHFDFDWADGAEWADWRVTVLGGAGAAPIPALPLPQRGKGVGAQGGLPFGLSVCPTSRPDATIAGDPARPPDHIGQMAHRLAGTRHSGRQRECGERRFRVVRT